MALSILAWSLVHDFSETAGEIVSILKPAIKSNLGDGAVGVAQLFGGLLYAHMHQMVDGGALEAVMKNALEVADRKSVV